MQQRINDIAVWPHVYQKRVSHPQDPDFMVLMSRISEHDHDDPP